MNWIVKWKTIKEDVHTGAILNSGLVEILAQHTFDDVQFKDRYIKATDDNSGLNLRIPYTSIYDIEDIPNEESKSSLASYVT